MRLAVVGSRGFGDYDTLKIVIDELRSAHTISAIVSGGAVGADKFAEQYASENNIEMKVFPAEWKKHGKAAGYIRNNFIWDDSDIGVAFWDGESKGTAHSFEISKKQRKLLYVFNYTDNLFYVLNDDTTPEFFSMKNNVKQKLNTDKEQ